MAQIFRNNVGTTLASGLSAAATTMALTDASGFPDPGSDFYLATLVTVNGSGQETAWEVVRVTAKSGSNLTIVRAQESTADATWPSGTPVQMRLTAGSMDGKAAATHAHAIADTTGLQAALDAKQATLVSGTNIKTVNGTTLLGSGNLAVGDVTLTGAQTLTNKTLTAPVISTISNTGTLTLPTSTDTLVGRATTDTLTNKTVSGGVYSGVVDQTGSVRGGITAMGALDVDCSAGNYFTKTISGASTFTFSNVPASRAYGFTLELTHTSGTVTWPASVKWPGDTAPTLATGKTHLFGFVTDDGGTRWRGVANVDYVN